MRNLIAIWILSLSVLVVATPNSMAEALSPEDKVALILGHCANDPDACRAVAEMMVCFKADAVCNTACSVYSEESCSAYLDLSEQTKDIATAACEAGLIQFCDCDSAPIKPACRPVAIPIVTDGLTPYYLAPGLMNGTGATAGGSGLTLFLSGGTSGSGGGSKGLAALALILANEAGNTSTAVGRLLTERGAAQDTLGIKLDDEWALVRVPKICQLGIWREGDLPEFCK
jgi:hypothetical protein